MPPMRLGIIGFEASGKTTIFNALTRGKLPTGALEGSGRMEVHSAAVDVPEPRLTPLAELYQPKKTTYAKVTFADIGGLAVGAGQEGLPGALLNTLSQVDGLLFVVRAFESEAVPHPLGAVDPQRDLKALSEEFVLHDMITVERRLERLQEERERGGRDRGTVEREIDLFQRALGVLEAEQPLRSIEFSGAECSALKGFGLLTLTPALVLVNLGERQEMPPMAAASEDLPLMGLQGELEMEIAQLEPEEEGAFLQEYGIAEPGRERVIRACYEHLGLFSFFTVGEDEVRAWTLPAGSTCLDAAGTIHTDLARGFIRAEVIPWDVLLDLGGFSEARKQGKLRLEGKEGPVADGDIVHVRFNI
jgi:GTP-binding protein YchF